MTSPLENTWAPVDRLVFVHCDFTGGVLVRAWRPESRERGLYYVSVRLRAPWNRPALSSALRDLYRDVAPVAAAVCRAYVLAHEPAGAVAGEVFEFRDRPTAEAISPPIIAGPAHVNFSSIVVRQ